MINILLLKSNRLLVARLSPWQQVNNMSDDTCNNTAIPPLIDIDKHVLTDASIIVPCPDADLEKKAKLLDADDWTAIRWLHFREERSGNQIAKEFGHSRKTVQKYLKEPNAPKYNMKKPRLQPLREKWREAVKQILEQDKKAPRKQRHTAKRIFDRLVKEQQYDGSLRTINQIVAEIKNKPASAASIPLLFQPGKDAQVDFGESFAKIAGDLVKFYGFEMRLCYSRRKFVRFYRSTDREAFLAGHVEAFEHFNGVVERCSYDNLSAAVAHVGEGKQRVLTDEFRELKGYYNFDCNFCQPGEKGAHEKGGVESGVGFSRRNWMVPVPEYDTLEQLNEYILEKCKEDEERQVKGQELCIGEAWKEEQALLLPLPAKPFDPVVKHSAVVDGYCTVAFKNNHYSVPPQYVGNPLSINSYCDRIEIVQGLETIAVHQRSYQKDEYILKPEHYLDLLEQRPHAVPYARPLLQYSWPDGYWEFYESMVEVYGTGDAGRNFIRILRSHLKYGSETVANAIKEARELGLANVDLVFAYADREHGKRIPPGPGPVNLEQHPELAGIKVSFFPEPEQYGALLDGGVICER
jgi:transposase